MLRTGVPVYKGFPLLCRSSIVTFPYLDWCAGISIGLGPARSFSSFVSFIDKEPRPFVHYRKRFPRRRVPFGDNDIRADRLQNIKKQDTLGNLRTALMTSVNVSSPFPRVLLNTVNAGHIEGYRLFSFFEGERDECKDRLRIWFETFITDKCHDRFRDLSIEINTRSRSASR